MDHFIDRHVARASRNLLVSSVVILALVAAAALIFGRYYQNYFGGPYPSSLEEIGRARSADDLGRYFVSLEGKLVETQYQEITKHTRHGVETSREVSAKYLVLKQGERSVLVKAETSVGPAASTPIVGYIRNPESVDAEVLGDASQDGELTEEVGHLAPYVLDATGFRTPGSFGLVGIGLALLIAGRNLRAWSARRSRPEQHPIWKMLARFGDPRSLAAQIDQEMRASDLLKVAGATLTRSWLVKETLFGLNLVPYDRLVWCHKKVTSRNGVKTYEAMLYDRDGRQLSLTSGEKAVDALLQEIAQRRAPWVITGWSGEIERAWKTQRAQMIAAVDERRQNPAQAGRAG